MFEPVEEVLEVRGLMMDYSLTDKDCCVVLAIYTIQFQVCALGEGTISWWATGAVELTCNMQYVWCRYSLVSMSKAVKLTVDFHSNCWVIPKIWQGKEICYRICQLLEVFAAKLRSNSPDYCTGFSRANDCPVWWTDKVTVWSWCCFSSTADGNPKHKYHCLKSSDKWSGRAV